MNLRAFVVVVALASSGCIMQTSPTTTVVTQPRPLSNVATIAIRGRQVLDVTEAAQTTTINLAQTGQIAEADAAVAMAAFLRIGQSGQRLAALLRMYAAATSLTAKANALNQVTLTIKSMDRTSRDVFVTMPTVNGRQQMSGVLHNVTDSIGNMLLAVGAEQAALAAGTGPR